MMLDSNAAGRDFTPNPLLEPVPGQGRALGRGHPVRMRARTRTRAGWDGRPAISGLGSTLLKQSLEYKWWEHLNDTAPPAPTAEWTAYYGPGGTYSQYASVKDAAADAAYEALPEDSGPVSLYVAMQCGPSDAACIAENERRQQANIRIIENANRAFNLRVCQRNSALNPGTVNDRDCTGLYSPLPVLTASGEMRTVSPSGGEYAIPIGGETAAQLQVRTQAWTAQQAASATTNQPNQSVPPRPQGGEVGAGGGITAAELAAILAAQNKGAGAGAGFSLVDADGKIMGLDPKMLMLIAAGVGALLLLKK